MKKIIGLCLLCATFCQSIVFAEVSDVAMKDDTCVIKGSGKIDEFVDILLVDGIGNTTENILGIDSFRINTTGEFERKIVVEKERIGNDNTIIAYIKIGDEEKKEYTLKYVSQDEIDRVVAILKSASNNLKLKNTIESNSDILSAIGFDMAAYSKADKQNTCEIFYNNREAEDVDTLVKNFNLAVFLSSYGAVDATELTECINNISPISCNTVEWSNLKEDKQAIAQILQKNAPYKTIEEFNAAFELGIALNKLNNASDYTKIEGILEENKNILKLSNSDNFKYLKENQVKTSKAMFNEILKNPVMTYSEFNSCLENAVKTAKLDSNNGQYSPGGNSGGSGSSKRNNSNSTISSGIVDLPANTAKDNENTAKQTFIDLDTGNWANEAVTNLYENGIVSGYEDGSFRPSKSVSREEFLSMLLRACDIATIGGTCPFDDVEYGKWYSPYVTTAWLKKIVSGIDENYFGLGAAITRQDIVVILDRTGKMCELDNTNKREYVPFDDEADIAEYAKSAVVSMYEYGVISGNNGCFMPNDTATRAETAVMIEKFTKLLKGAQQ